MSNPITDLQTRYLAALVKNVDQDQYEEFKKRLKIPVDAPISELSKDDAYRLITKIVTESTPEQVEDALAAALGRQKKKKRPVIQRRKINQTSAVR